MSAFFDTNVLVYTVSDDPKRPIAEGILAQGGVISAQVLNEYVNTVRGKFRHDWPQIERSLRWFRDVFDQIRPVTIALNEAAVGLARDHGLHIYDALIVAAALEAGCDTLFSEDMQDGRKFGGLTIRNPFIEAV